MKTYINLNLLLAHIKFLIYIDLIGLTFQFENSGNSGSQWSIKNWIVNKLHFTVKCLRTEEKEKHKRNIIDNMQYRFDVN